VRTTQMGDTKAHRAQPAITVVASAAVGLMLFAAGCGGGPSGAAATPAADDSMAQAVEFSTCMRTHGIADYPDPKPTDSGVALPAPDSGSAEFAAAEKICKKFLSGSINPTEQAQAQARLLRYAECMRKHGVVDFPDPDNSGRLPSSFRQIDSGTPGFVAAKKSCADVLRRP